ncbi:Aspartyl-tRNA(Asn) amidotransferase subunit C [Chitinispirillum alkaliphilum]|nr:Aspartyl-tRNA(Asn) amidotransferase subunit C [Chitinispirillum alkaliphilum]
MIDKQTVLYVAELAKLKLSDTEVQNFTSQLGSIIDYIDLLNSAPTEGVEPTCMVAPAHDPLRDDEPTGSLNPEQTLSNGPSVKKGHFAVPKVIGG